MDNLWIYEHFKLGLKNKPADSIASSALNPLQWLRDRKIHWHFRQIKERESLISCHLIGKFGFFTQD